MNALGMRWSQKKSSAAACSIIKTLSFASETVAFSLCLGRNLHFSSGCGRKPHRKERLFSPSLFYYFCNWDISFQSCLFFVRLHLHLHLHLHLEERDEKRIRDEINGDRWWNALLGRNLLPASVLWLISAVRGWKALLNKDCDPSQCPYKCWGCGPHWWCEWGIKRMVSFLVNGIDRDGPTARTWWWVRIIGPRTQSSNPNYDKVGISSWCAWLILIKPLF